MQRTALYMVLILLCQVNVMAQGILVQGSVRDAFGCMGIEQAKVQILDGDSLIVAEAMTEIVGGVEANKTCDFHATADTCSGYCDYEGKSGTCTYGEVALWTGCYCVIE